MPPLTPTSSTETLISIPTTTTSASNTILLAHQCPACGRIHLQIHASSPSNPLPPRMPCVAHTLTTGPENATCHFERLTHIGDIDIRTGKISAGEEKIIKDICWGKGNRLCEKKTCGKVQANHWLWKCEGGGVGGGQSGDVGGKGEMGDGGAAAAAVGKVKGRAGVGAAVVLVGACLVGWWVVVCVGGL